MSFFSFLKDSGEKVLDAFKSKDAQASNALHKHLERIGLDGYSDLDIKVQDDKVIVSGEVKTQEEKEKILLSLGNVRDISSVEDNIKVLEPTSQENIEPKFVVVEKGDTLSKISQRIYGDPTKYNIIFEANKPMLQHPDKIYPGQKLRIPS